VSTEEGAMVKVKVLPPAESKLLLAVVHPYDIDGMLAE
jgi:hypothetical protein